MKILSSGQIKILDQKTATVQNISSWQLMERASEAVTDAILHKVKGLQPSFCIFCGKGNNGGDGLAVARMLLRKNFDVTVFLLHSDKYSDDNLENQKRLKNIGLNVITFNERSRLEIPSGSLIIDALFGNGLHSPLNSEWNTVFSQIESASPLHIFAIDLPSGFMADHPMEESFPCLKTDHVFTFEIPKPGLLFPPSYYWLKDFSIVKIGLDEATRESLDSFYYYTEKSMIQALLKPVSKFSHKGTFGHVLIIGGSYGKTGAPVLSAKAALKTGSGLVSLYLPKCGYNSAQTSLTEAMCITDTEEKHITETPDISAYQAVAIGMGAGQQSSTAEAVLKCLKENPNASFVIDADALNVLSKQEDPFLYIPENSILTPHPKELQRLIGSWDNDFEKIEKVRTITQRYKINILIKGAYTVSVLSDGNCYFNATGNWGMATAGAGDTLSGVLVSLAGQGYSSHEACILGTYLHGLAGDLAIEKIHPHSLTAGNISDFISEAYFDLTK
ncbi:NAD(P)H-hydrate dehydratase [Elizabethkingia meningoseptica]|uniref:NAD(P)H-hydrate dehydratase n=1 Tax=Elizabethkingia meningoseptica TaxID=238 RepID=UPI003733F141